MSQPIDYAGPFPRKKHSHRCKTCGQGTYCYKARCTKPQRVEQCFWCMRTNAEKKKDLIESLAHFLVDNQAGKSIALQMEGSRPPGHKTL